MVLGPEHRIGNQRYHLGITQHEAGNGSLKTPLTATFATRRGSGSMLHIKREEISYSLFDRSACLQPQRNRYKDSFHRVNPALAKLWEEQNIPEASRIWSTYSNLLREKIIALMSIRALGIPAISIRQKYASKIDKWLFKHFGFTSLAPAFPSSEVETVSKNGHREHSPVIYFEGPEDSIYLVSTNGGLKGNPHWFKNVQANPDDVTFSRTKTGRVAIDRYKAEILNDNSEETQLLWDQMVTIAPFLTIYVQFKNWNGDLVRTLPIIRLRPLKECILDAN